MNAARRPAFARWLGTTNDITAVFLAAGRVPGLINMAGGLPAPELYPAEELAAIARDVVHRHPQDVLGYGPVEGLPELRDALARRHSSPVLPLTRDNVLVTAGGMAGLELIGKVLLDEGGVVAGQFPTYLGALDAWRPRAPDFRNMIVEADDFAPETAMRGAQFAYTVPNFSNPTGRMVGTATRRALAEAAHRTGTWLVEDDPYGTLFYEGAPPPRLIDVSATMLGAGPYKGPVVYMGTASKEIAPGLRIGWVIAAPELIAVLAKAKQGTEMCTSGITQRIALGALDAGVMERSLPRVLATYRQRRDALCAAMAEHLSERFTWEVPTGGMFVWAVARDPEFDSDGFVRRAMTAGVCVAPSSAFDATGLHRRALRINFTLNEPARLAEGVERLAAALTT